MNVSKTYGKINIAEQEIILQFGELKASMGDVIMPYEKLSLKGFIEEIKEVTDGFHPRKFCFVLGAGASRSSGIKSGQELVKIWDKELRERNENAYYQWREEKSITDENMSSFYSQYYEKRFCRCPTDGYNYIEKIMESATPSAGYVMLAHLLTKTPHNVVITTNFDHLTEDAVNYYAQNTPLVIGHEALSRYVSAQPVRPTVIKIHRDLLFDPKSRSKDLERLPDSWKNALELIFTNYHPIFIGYAGNDKSLMDFLIENAERFAHDEWKYPYWMLYKTDQLEGRVEQFLEKSEGVYIFHDGFDEVFIQLGAAFDYILPKEDDFLKDARSRYKALVDAIDALSDTSKAGNIEETISNNKENTPKEALPSPKSVETEENINWALEKITSQSEQQRKYREASNFMTDGKYTEAVNILEQLVKLDAENARYHQSLGDAFSHLAQYDEAVAEYHRVLELEGPNVNTFQKLSDVFLQMEQFEKAREMLLKAAAFCAENGDDDDHYWIANSFELMHEYEDALNEYRKASMLDPSSYIYHYCVANMLVHTNQNEAAVERAKKAISLNPNFYLSHYVLGKALRALGRIKEADQADQRAKELQTTETEL